MMVKKGDAIMWRLYFEICDFLAGFIPNKKLREKIRREDLYDYRKKYNALRCALPHAEFKRVQVIKGGWNIGFIVDNKYVCKIRKHYDREIPTEKIMREKRITDAFAKIVPLKILKINILNAGGYTFYRYNFIPGKNLNRMREKTIIKYRNVWGKQLAGFINAMHNSDPVEIADLKTDEGDGWNHNDICNNIIVDKKTMKIVGIIDWEYSGWGKLETEFENCVHYSKKVRNSGIGDVIRREYNKLQHKS